MSNLIWQLGAPGSFTFAMVKPDGFKQGLLGEILKMAFDLDAQLTPILVQVHTLSEADVEFLYGHVKQEHPEVYPTLKDFSMSGPSDLIVFRRDDLNPLGINAVTAWRDLMGATRSGAAAPGTIRHRWGSREITCKNIVHGSDSEARANEEITYFAHRLGW